MSDTADRSAALPKGRRSRRRQPSAVKAREAAQQLAFSPIIFYAVTIARDLGLLSSLFAAGQIGLTREQLARESDINDYALRLLADVCVDAGVVEYKRDRLRLADMGYFVLNDNMTRVNMDFVRDICYRAMPYLQEALETGEPTGMKTLGDWDTVYHGLSQLPEPEKSSWFNFDHYYSDQMFSSALPLVFDRPVARLMDIGCNTGKWARHCLKYDPDVSLVMVDLPGQIEMARESMGAAGLLDRAQLAPLDILRDELPDVAPVDVVWMSQFLDCFDPESVIAIMSKARQKLAPAGRVIIVEHFSDRQEYAASTLSVNASSLYFSCVANGCSRFYEYHRFQDWVRKAGLVIRSEEDLNTGHTVLICEPSSEGT